MDSDNHFSLISFTDETKKVCMCSAISLFLIILFIISPLSNIFMVSPIMKLIILILLLYTIYLNNEQTNFLRKASQNPNQSKDVHTQLSINIMCSYTFTLFIGLLVIFVIKSFF
jgi:amino acid transporter